MKRRQFITLVGGAATWPLVARAQQIGKLPTIGFLGAGSPATADVWLSAFTSRLRELGWIEDRNIKIDVRWAEGRNDRSTCREERLSFHWYCEREQISRCVRAQCNVIAG
jgi:putative ABC transport system substrate-binding protein